MKRGSTSLTTGEIKNKTIPSIKRIKIDNKNPNNTNWERVWNNRNSCTTQLVHLFWNSLAIYTKAEHVLAKKLHPLLYPRKLITSNENIDKIIKADLFVIDKNWEQSQIPNNNTTNKLWYIHQKMNTRDTI